MEKGLKFILSRRNGTVAFNLNLVLLLIEVDPIAEEQSCKKDAFKNCSISCVKMIFALSAEVVSFYICDCIIQVGVTGFENFILESKICLAIFLSLNKQF